MNKNYLEGVALINEINRKLHDISGYLNPALHEVVVAPPFTLLHKAAKEFDKGLPVSVAAQNCAAEKAGAFTGEVSAEMVISTGAKYVIIGHSERRTLFGEQDAILAQKTRIALETGLMPIFCVGELLAERNKKNHFQVIQHQLSVGLFVLPESLFKRVVIAYEPVWAIGTGATATPYQAQEMHQFIRTLVGKKYNSSVADNTTLLYGGSCKPLNAVELFANQDVDGGLIGGASLKADDFIAIVMANINN